MKQWLIRLIPLLGYVLDLERQLEQARQERDVYLDRILQLTTGLGMKAGAPLPGREPIPEVPPEPSIVEKILTEEQKSYERAVEQFEGMTAADYENWIHTGAPKAVIAPVSPDPANES